MDYPTRLLPNPNYKRIEENINDFWLLRYTISNDPAELIEQATGFIKAKHICTPRENVFNLSTSLFGIFRIEDSFIELTENGHELYSEYCDPDTEVETPIYRRHFEFNRARGQWFISISDLNLAPIEYSLSDKTYTAICLVRHTPMKWNYWHFSIRWKLQHIAWEELDQSVKTKWARRLAHDARSHIQKFANIHAPNPREISETLFLKDNNQD